MRTALKEPIVNTAAIEREMTGIIKLISARNLLRARDMLAAIADEDAEDYQPHTFDDLSDETRRRIIDTDSGVNTIGPISFDDAVTRWKAMCERDNAQRAAENA